MRFVLSIERSHRGTFPGRQSRVPGLDFSAREPLSRAPSAPTDLGDGADRVASSCGRDQNTRPKGPGRVGPRTARGAGRPDPPRSSRFVTHAESQGRHPGSETRFRQFTSSAVCAGHVRDADQTRTRSERLNPRPVGLSRPASATRSAGTPPVWLPGRPSRVPTARHRCSSQPSGPTICRPGG